ncbi:transcription factor EAT1-like [Lolium perenne]|uniref:transcription factor EAT1-like n=1 Tax=Lolium perenne TaxID=4522 RepID=UPI0021F658A0|nr:transcription factor EAT1-like [Lolium perenne]
MIAEGGYFDGSEDAILMAGSLIHDSLESICDNTEIEQGNFHGASFIEDVCNPTNLTSEPAQTINHIQQRAGLAMQQNLHGHMIQEETQVETSNWVPSIFSIPNHILSHQSMEQQMNDCDAASYPNGAHTAAPDLLNLLQIPRYSMTPAFPSTKCIFGDPGQDAGNHLDIQNEVLGGGIHDIGMMLSDSTLPLHYNGNQPQLFKDLYHSIPQSYGLFPSDDERDGTMEVVGGAGNIFQEMDGRQFGSQLLGRKSKKGGFGKGKTNFATERERREQINVKYGALRLLLPSPTKNDRASIVGDAIEYINELNRTLKELKSLVEEDTKYRIKRLKLDDTTPDDGDSSSLQPVRDDQENQLNGATRSSWIQRRSKECHVDVRIVGNEINIKFTEKKKTNSLLCAAKVLDEFRLELIHVGGGVIGDQRIFMFNTKIPESSSVYASALAMKLLRAVEMEHLAADIFS